MIGQLRGVLTYKKPPYLLLDVGGVGYELQTSMMTIYKLPAIGESVLLHTNMVIREDAQLLYGFFEENEKIVFKELIKISGVGPKLALAILSGMDVKEIIYCISQRDAQRLVGLPGVGMKTAERLIVEMQGKLSKKLNFMGINDFEQITLNNNSSSQNDAIGALIALGYKPNEAQSVVKKVATADIDSESLIRLSLKNLAK